MDEETTYVLRYRGVLVAGSKHKTYVMVPRQPLLGITVAPAPAASQHDLLETLLAYHFVVLRCQQAGHGVGGDQAATREAEELVGLSENRLEPRKFDRLDHGAHQTCVAAYAGLHVASGAYHAAKNENPAEILPRWAGNPADELGGILSQAQGVPVPHAHGTSFLPTVVAR